MSLPTLTLRRWKRSMPSMAPSSLRSEVCPPSLRCAPESAWLRLWFWLLAPAPGDAAPPPSRLQPARQDFLQALKDLHAHPETSALLQRVEQARSLRELWHLRADVYGLVGLHRSQSEAEQRLMHLNRHFPTRAPRSGFAPL